MNKTIIIDCEARRASASYCVSSLSLKEKHSVTIEPYEETRTDNANRRYWACISAALEWIEEKECKRIKKEIFHEWLKTEILGQNAVEIMGKVKHITPPSRTMTKKEFHAYTEKAELYLLEVLGVPAETMDYHIREAA